MKENMFLPFLYFTLFSGGGKKQPKQFFLCSHTNSINHFEQYISFSFSWPTLPALWPRQAKGGRGDRGGGRMKGVVRNNQSAPLQWSGWKFKDLLCQKESELTDEACSLQSHVSCRHATCTTPFNMKGFGVKDKPAVPLMETREGAHALCICSLFIFFRLFPHIEPQSSWLHN